MITENGVRIWATDLDDITRRQAEVTARLPILAGPVALMPDAHLGIGATIGSVIATESTIIPSAVGVDLGCGMIAVETNITLSDLPDSLDPLVHQWGRSIPSGIGRSHPDATPTAIAWMKENPPSHELSERTANAAVTQLGSLGSGNHFVELCVDERGVVWVILHSGSRNVGNSLAQNHIKIARALNQDLEDKDLAYFTQGTSEFSTYIQDMLWAQQYAFQNRHLIMDAALADVFRYVAPGHEVSRINCHHNYALQEWHDGHLLWITRKGAIRAEKGDLGLIPGSMGTGSFVVRGLGNPDSYNSAAHGAGRRISRGEAKRTLTVKSLEDIMDGKAWNKRDSKALLDEHPASYKNINQVMADQKDLVEIVHSLTQLANFKGV